MLEVLGGKIDVVYLWVDGADPVWRAKRQLAHERWQGARRGDLAVYGNVEGRYRDNGELRFNLRALKRFFPDHGHVYIVTDGQKPEWLKPSAGLTIVDHSTLLPKGAPVYDSANIESWLHHIPGLSERFIYLNDDVFFGAPVDVDWWFGERLRVFIEAELIAEQDGFQANAMSQANASVLSKDWLAATYADYAHVPHIYSHSPRPMRKSLMLELESLAPELFKNTRSTTFRSWRVPALIPDLVPRWMVHMGHAEEEVLDPLYISTGDADAAEKFAKLEAEFGTLPFFCINDTCDDADEDDPRLLMVSRTLQQLLPEPSSFEESEKTTMYRRGLLVT